MGLGDADIIIFLPDYRPYGAGEFGKNYLLKNKTSHYGKS